ncbi:penicillin-binding transpeptidase domain-containing protein, partial [Flavobacteriaceae bacterium]|nr:penicillin-binding transpeptidase domain-containing protein [Flavobacteriaceae bacterium]MDA7741214.1 penicillin-binding transpeptidase domain-containing protein [Flavobacteriaceae bacterium]
DTTELSKLINIEEKELREKISNAINYSSKIPSLIKTQISKEENAFLQEKIWLYEGFYLRKNSVRDYIKPFASNLIGYTGEVDQTEINTDNYYEKGEMIGKQGIEKYYEDELRGKKGAKYFQKDRFNRVIGSYDNSADDVNPVKANNITLTIDIKLQEYAESLLKNKKGGVVVIEPATGEILTLVSAPTYESNQFIGQDRSDNFQKLLTDSINKPLFDRSLQAQYSPGSPMKILNALIGLQEGVIDENTTFTCNAGHYYARNAFMGCHNKFGTISNLRKGIYNSCNTYFAKTYKLILDKYKTPSEGLDTWANHIKSFGLGDYLGYDLFIGKKGFIPESDYYNRFYGNNRWGSSTTISNSIGQGEILTTPIQMANFTSAVANRGFYYKPHFVKKINNESIFNEDKVTTTIDKENFEIVIDGMVEVVNKGTARIAKINGINVAGKTGTVENFILIENEKKQLTDHSTFIAFAPAENPEIVVSVFIENGYWGSRWAAPIASLIIEKYLTDNIERKWLENRMVNGSLQSEYEKPYKFKTFTINE